MAVKCNKIVWSPVPVHESRSSRKVTCISNSSIHSTEPSENVGFTLALAHFKWIKGLNPTISTEIGCEIGSLITFLSLPLWIKYPFHSDIWRIYCNLKACVLFTYSILKYHLTCFIFLRFFFFLHLTHMLFFFLHFLTYSSLQSRAEGNDWK